MSYPVIIPARWHCRCAKRDLSRYSSSHSEWRLIQRLFSSMGGGSPHSAR
jgi:hypothetical protein